MQAFGEKSLVFNLKCFCFIVALGHFVWAEWRLEHVLLCYSPALPGHLSVFSPSPLRCSLLPSPV